MDGMQKTLKALLFKGLTNLLQTGTSLKFGS